MTKVNKVKINHKRKTASHEYRKLFGPDEFVCEIFNSLLRFNLH